MNIHSKRSWWAASNQGTRSASSQRVFHTHQPRSPEDLDPGYRHENGIIHPVMHPGLWIGFGDIHGQDYWRLKARVENDDGQPDGLVPLVEDTKQGRFMAFGGSYPDGAVFIYSDGGALYIYEPALGPAGITRQHLEGNLGTGTVTLSLHFTLKTVHVELQFCFTRYIGCQVGRETIRVVQLENHFTGYDLVLQSGNSLIQDFHIDTKWEPEMIKKAYFIP